MRITYTPGHQREQKSDLIIGIWECNGRTHFENEAQHYNVKA